MKKIIYVLLFSLCTASVVFSQATGRVQLFGHLDKRHGGNTNFYSGCWGWTNPNDNREYGIIGCINGTSIVEVTNADSMREVAYIPGAPSGWREAKTWSHYAYVVIDATPNPDSMSGVHIIDLSQLPDTAILVKKFNYANGNKNIKRSHEIFIDENGYMYLFGNQNWQPSGVLIFSLANPTSPQFVGEWQPNSEYIHDGFVRNDTIFGAAIYGAGIFIADIHNKSNPVAIAQIQYPNAGTHNIWTSSDGRTLFSTDEIGNTAKTLKVWDISNLPNYTMIDEYTPNPAAIVHNVQVRDSLAFVSWYSQGLVVANISDPANVTTVGTYDSYPGADGGYNGAWGIFAFVSGTKAIISDRSTGTYACVVLPPVSVPAAEESFPAKTQLAQNYPNPFNPYTIIHYSLAVASHISLKIYDAIGKEIAILINEFRQSGNYEVRFDGSKMPSGVYFMQLTTVSGTETKKIILQK